MRGRLSWYVGHVDWTADEGPALVILRRCGRQERAEEERKRLRRPSGEVFAWSARVAPGRYDLAQILSAAAAAEGAPLRALHTF